MIKLKKSYRILAYTLTAVLIIAIIGLTIYYLVKNAEDDEDNGAERLPRGGVVTNGHDCANIGASILNKGGNAVDAAIAALFCEGVSMPHSMGLGGGFFMTIYNRETRRAVHLNARETAPKDAKKDMFHGDTNLPKRGGLAVAVPGELKGYWEAYQKYGGKVPWRDLVQPTIDICRNGILVTDYLERLFSTTSERLHADPGLKEAFIDPSTNQTYKSGQYVKRLRLAKTLELIADEGADVLYNGKLTEDFVKDIRDKNGIITVDDMKNYSVEWQQPLKVNMPFGQTLYTSPLPGSGIILGFIMNILNDFLDYSEPESVTNWQKIVESFKYGYGKRTELGDPDFVNISDLVYKLTSPEYARIIREKITLNTTFQDPAHYGANTTLPDDHGTAHISILAPNGDAVSVTSTVNLYFGAAFMSLSTGIILNDEMDDFSAPNITNEFGVPPSVANFIEPRKRPMSSMCPAVIVGSNDDVKLVVGAAGGTKITTSVALIAIRNLWFNITIADAVSQKRLHHQLFPMEIQFEAAYQDDRDFVAALHKIGHNYTIATADSGFAAVTAVSKENNLVQMATDKRRSGSRVYVY